LSTLDTLSSKPEGKPHSSSWFRFASPSITDVIFIVLLYSLSTGPMTLRLLGDAGIGWHIRNGELILQTHSITRVDPFSYTMGGKAWYAWEWLYDVVIAASHHSFGLNGVVFFTALVIATTFALTFRLMIRSGASVSVAVILLVLALGASSIHFLTRPHVLSWLLVVIWFQLLDDSQSAQDRRRLFWLPVLALVWANMHGGFIVGFVLIALYMIADVILYLRNRESRGATAARLKTLGAAAALCLLASLANPYGYKLHVHVYRYLTDRWLMNHIDEFLSPNFHGVAQQCFVLLLLISIVAWSVAPIRPRFVHVLMVLFAAHTGLYASRNLPVSCILLVLIIAPVLSQAGSAAATNPGIPARTREFFAHLESFTSRMGSLEALFAGHLWAVAATVLGLIICAHQGRLGATPMMDAHFDAKRFPVQAVDVIESRSVREPIFSLDSWGGYLIYRLYPKTKVFVDDRHDLYGAEFLKDYLRAIRVTPDWDTMLNSRRVNCVLVPAESSLANILKETQAWTINYEDKVAVLFRRTNPL
jgi:hypothetical protein